MANDAEDLSTDEAALSRLFGSIEEFRKHDKQGSLTTIEAFALIACRAPLSRGELAQALEISKPSATSVLQRLSGNNPKHRPRWTQPQMRLVTTVPDPKHSGRAVVALTPAGVLLAERMAAFLEDNAAGDESPSAT